MSLGWHCKVAPGLNSAIFALNSLPIYSQFGIWVLLLLSICLDILSEIKLFIFIFFWCLFCYSFVLYCLKMLVVIRWKMVEYRDRAYEPYCSSWPHRLMNLQFYHTDICLDKFFCGSPKVLLHINS